MALFGICGADGGSGTGQGGGQARALIIGPHRLGPDIGLSQLAALIDRPGFDAAMFDSARCIVAGYRGSWLMNRILSDRGRMMALYMALDLHFTDPLRRGFSVVQLCDVAARSGFASRGRMTAWVASLRLLGLLADGAPGRPRRLLPTAKLLLIVRSQMEDFHQSVAQFYPLPPAVGPLLQQDWFLTAIIAGFTELYRGGQRILEGTPELAGLAEQEAGITVLMSIMLKDEAGEAVTLAGLAREFYVSRAHVRGILRHVATLGLVWRAPGAAGYQARPKLAEVMRRFFAAVCEVYVFALQCALAQDGAGRSLAAISAADSHARVDAD